LGIIGIQSTQFLPPEHESSFFSCQKSKEKALQELEHFREKSVLIPHNPPGSFQKEMIRLILK